MKNKITKSIMHRTSILIIILILFVTHNYQYVNAGNIKDSKAEHLLELYIKGDDEINKSDVISAIYDLENTEEKENLLEKLDNFENKNDKDKTNKNKTMSDMVFFTLIGIALMGAILIISEGYEYQKVTIIGPGFMLIALLILTTYMMYG